MYSIPPLDEMAGGDVVNASEPPKEVDFYTNPTILSRLILNQKYSSAVKRLKQHPEEASTWVCSKRNPFKQGKTDDEPDKLPSTDSPVRKLSRKVSSRMLPAAGVLDYTIRQLPIHVACANLIRSVNDVELRTDLERLITHLVVTYPDGCNQVDHDGKLPLHEALWLNATPETISMLLIASPSTLHEKDKYDRTPLDLNRLRTGQNKELIKQMLLRGTHFWEQAAEAAAEKMKELDEAKAARWKQQKKEKKLPPITETSDDVVADQEEKSVAVRDTSWMKLEKRAIRLEQLLAGMYEKNYDLGELVQELNQEKIELIEKVKFLEASDPKSIEASNNLATLQNENTELKSRVANLEDALQQSSEQKSSEEKENSDILEYLKERNEILLQQVDELTQANHDNQVKVDRLELLVESFQKRALPESDQIEVGAISEDASTDFTITSIQDFETLVDTIQSQSHYATERFLARKIIDLEEQLNDVRVSAENDLISLRRENNRLIMENRALTVGFASMSSRNLSSPKSGGRSVEPRPTGPGVTESAFSTSFLHDSANSFRSDNLNDIFQQAAEMYGDTVYPYPIPQQNVASAPNTSASSDDKKGGNTEEQSQRSPSLKPVFVNHIINAVQRDYAQGLSLELESALRTASESTVSGGDGVDTEAFMKKVKNLYGEELPTELAEVLRASLSEGGAQPLEGGLDTVTELEPTSTKIELENALVERILQDAAQLCGRDIPRELADAFRQASLTSVASPEGRLKTGFEGGPISRVQEQVGSVLEETERLHGRPVDSNLMVALKRASCMSFDMSISEKNLAVGSEDQGRNINNTVSVETAGVTEDGERDHNLEENQSGKDGVEEVTPVATVTGDAPGCKQPMATEVAMNLPGSGGPQEDYQLTLPTPETTELNDTNSQEFEHVMGEAEALCGRPVSQPMRVSLQKAALKFLDSEQSAENFEAFFAEAGRDCGEAIPIDLQKAIRHVSGLDDIEEIEETAIDWKATESMSFHDPGGAGTAPDKRIEKEIHSKVEGVPHSVGPGDGDDDQTLSTMDDGFASIMQEARRLNGGQSLSPEWMAWWKAARVSASTLRTEGQDESQAPADTISLATEERHEILKRFAKGSIRGWDDGSSGEEGTVFGSIFSSIIPSSNPKVSRETTSVSVQKPSAQSRSASSSERSYLPMPSSKFQQNDPRLRTPSQLSALSSRSPSTASGRSRRADVVPPQLASRQSSGSQSLNLNSSSASFYPGADDLLGTDNLDEIFKQAAKSYSDIIDDDRP